MAKSFGPFMSARLWKRFVISFRSRGFYHFPSSREHGRWGSGSGERKAGFAPQDFLVFNQQFVALIRAGLPILRSLDLLKGRIANPQLQTHIESVREKVVSGISLSDALVDEHVFPRVYTASVFAGERSGDLVEVINRYIRYQKTILTATKKFRNSLIYPGFLIVLSIVMVGVILGYVIPRFGELYAGMNTALPLATQILIAVAGGHPEQPAADGAASYRRADRVSILVRFGGRAKSVG